MVVIQAPPPWYRRQYRLAEEFNLDLRGRLQAPPLWITELDACNRNELIPRLKDLDTRVRRSFLRHLFGSALGLLTFGALIAVMVSFDLVNTNEAALMAGVFAAGLSILAYLHDRAHRLIWSMVARIVAVVDLLYGNPDAWQDVRLIASIAPQLRRLGNQLLRMPTILAVRDRDTRLVSVEVAGGAVQMQCWLSMPLIDTRQNLIDELEQMLVKVSFGQWYQMRRVDTELASRSRLLKSVLLFGLGILALVAALLVTIYGDVLPTAIQPLLAAVASVVAASCLTSAGVRADGANAIAEAAKRS